MNSLIELSSSLVVGSVESVSPSRIVATLDIEAPQSTALNTGHPRGFPRVNSYILIPNEAGAVVGLITWVGIENSMYPSRKKLEDLGLINLPFPTRKVHIVPIGILQTNYPNLTNDKSYSLKRGLTTFPSIGDKIILPNKKQYEAIIGEGEDDKNFVIGYAPMAYNEKVRLDTDKIFGRHLAILGNTGSGKSCSMAGVIRWSLENARNSLNNGNINARFIILDPNGEYKHAFSDFNARVFQVEVEENMRALKVPAWLWNSDEWSIFTSATKQTQKPLLDQSLKEIKSGHEINDSDEEQLYKLIKARKMQLNSALNEGPDRYSGSYIERMNFGNLLGAIKNDVNGFLEIFIENTTLHPHIKELYSEIDTILDQRSHFSSQGNLSYNSFSYHDLVKIIEKTESLIKVLESSGVQEFTYIETSSNSPIPFTVDELPSVLELKSSETGTEQYIQYLITRINTMLADIRVNQIISGDKNDSLLDWLEDYIGKDKASNGNITVIDLSLVPSELTHIITSVISRVIFESIQRYRKLNEGKSLPTVIAVEEAHNFIKNYNEEDTPASVCTQTFEKIAREGRKYGLGLVISSQRPYELSPTVLSQCNTFLLHRIVNDRDQDIVNRLVPDNLEGLLNELPNLPSRHAIIVGWAAPVPIIVKIKELEERYRPISDDPEYYNVWTRRKNRNIDWEKIIKDWK